MQFSDSSTCKTPKGEKCDSRSAYSSDTPLVLLLYSLYSSCTPPLLLLYSSSTPPVLPVLPVLLRYSLYSSCTPCTPPVLLLYSVYSSCTPCTPPVLPVLRLYFTSYPGVLESRVSPLEITDRTIQRILKKDQRISTEKVTAEIKKQLDKSLSATE